MTLPPSSQPPQSDRSQAQAPNARGAVDLSQLSSRASSAPTRSDGAQPTAGVFAADVDESGLQTLLQQSMQVAVLLEIYSSASGTPSSVLADEVNAQGGKLLLGRVDIAQSPQIAAALGLQPNEQLPLVVAVLRGQMLPLFSGAVSTDQLKAVVAQVLQAAVANGVTGRAAPIAEAQSEASTPAEPQVDERLVALMQQAQTDLDGAVAQAQKLLTQTPNDDQLKLLAASLKLQQQLKGAPADVVQQADAAPLDIDLQVQAAGMEFTDPNHPAGDLAAYQRLLGVMGRTAGDDRDQARKALLQLFEIAGPQDPNVAGARKKLTALMF